MSGLREGTFVKLLPVALNVAKKRCLVVGGGEVALRKTRALLECEADVTIIAPQLHNDFNAQMAFIQYAEKPFARGDCAGFQLVFACTNNAQINAQIAQEARALGIRCNIADDPRNSDLHTVATVRRGDITIGISSGSVSPLLSRHIKERIERCIGAEYEQLIALVARIESESNSLALQARKDKWRAILESDALLLLRDSKLDEVESLLRGLLK